MHPRKEVGGHIWEERVEEEVGRDFLEVGEDAQGATPWTRPEGEGGAVHLERESRPWNPRKKVDQ